MLYRVPVIFEFLKVDSHIAFRAHAVPLRVKICLSHLIYTVRSCLIHTCHAAPMPCCHNAVLLKATALHGRLSTAVQCCGLEKNGMFGTWHGHGVASVNQKRSHCVNQMGRTHSKPLAARHGNGMLCVNRP